MNAAATRVTYYVASWCLDYPEVSLISRLPTLRQALKAAGGDPAPALSRMLDYIETAPLDDLQQSYVELFDFSRRHALYLSYWTDGDTRRRGDVLLKIKQRYRASGYLVNTRGELPDYLPIVLDYAAVADPSDGQLLLQEYRASLELLRFALLESDQLYGDVVTAVCETLPGASPSDRRAAHQMAAAGPPREDVGLEPYDPRLLPLADATAGSAEQPGWRNS